MFQEKLQSWLTAAIFKWSSVKIRSILAIRKWRANSVIGNIVCTFADMCGMFLWHSWALFVYRYVENPNPYWVQYSKMSLYENCYESFLAQTHLLDNKWEEAALSESDFIARYSELYAAYYKECYHWATREYHPYKYKYILIGKHNPISRIIRTFTTPVLKDEPKWNKKSHVDFLTIEYRWSPSKPPLAITIPSSHYMVGNELLSAAYIMHYLKHLPIYTNWQYSSDYTITVVDDNMDEFILTAGKYVKLREHDFEILDEQTEYMPPILTHSCLFQEYNPYAIHHFSEWQYADNLLREDEEDLADNSSNTSSELPDLIPLDRPSLIDVGADTDTDAEMWEEVHHLKVD